MPEAQTDYNEILDRSWDDIPEPKPLPVGSYLLKLRNASYQPPKSEDKSPVVLFVYTPKEAMDDVDADAITELGPDYDLAANRIFSRFYVEDNTDWDTVRKHIAKHGVEPKGSIKESLKAVKGAEVIAFLNQRTFTRNDGEVSTENVASNFTPVDA